MQRHSLDELNTPMSFWEKLWLTFKLLLFGAVVGPLLWVGMKRINQQPTQWIVEYAVKTIGVFYVTLLVFVWWRPAALKWFYASKERVIDFWLIVLRFAVLAFMIVGAIKGVRTFFEI